MCVSNFSLTLKIAPPAKGSVLLMHLRDGLWCANLLLQEFDPLEKQHGNAWKDFSLFVGSATSLKDTNTQHQQQQFDSDTGAKSFPCGKRCYASV